MMMITEPSKSLCADFLVVKDKLLIVRGNFHIVAGVFSAVNTLLPSINSNQAKAIFITSSYTLPTFNVFLLQILSHRMKENHNLMLYVI